MHIDDDGDRPEVFVDYGADDGAARKLRASKEAVQTANYVYRTGMRGYREELGWSQRRLSEEVARLGVKLDQSAITRIERGDREPKYSEVVAISEALHMPVVPQQSRSHEVVLECMIWLSRFSEFRKSGHALRERLAANEALPEGFDLLLARLPDIGWDYHSPADGMPSVRVTGVDDDPAS